MNMLVLLGIIAIVIQFTVERLKVFIAKDTSAWLSPLIALVLGVVISFATQTGVFTAFGVAIAPLWIDYIITGIAYSGGAVAFNELIKLVQEMRPSNGGDTR